MVACDIANVTEWVRSPLPAPKYNKIDIKNNE